MRRIPMVSLRLVRERTIPYSSNALNNAHAVYELFREIAENLDREAIWVVCLDTKNRVTCLSQVSVGTLNSALVHPREIFKIALVSNSMAVITVHNHPSGDPEPSPDDCLVTEQMKAAAKTLGIKFLDHVIIGDGKFYSFADEGGL